MLDLELLFGRAQLFDVSFLAQVRPAAKISLSSDLFDFCFESKFESK